MIVQLYNCSSDHRRVTKSIDLVATYNNVDIKENTSIVDPIFKLSKPPDVDSLPVQFNYLYCPYLKRYYFVNDVVYCTGGILEIHCHVDVLYTYKDYIYAKKTYIKRSEKEFYKNLRDSSNGIFFDPEYPIRTDSYTWSDASLEFGQVANNKSYYLTVNGGVVST